MLKQIPGFHLKKENIHFTPTQAVHRIQNDDASYLWSIEYF